MKLPIDYNKASFQDRRIARKEYIRIQNDLCYHCKELLSGHPPFSITDKRINKSLFPSGFFKWPIHLHHNHKTGMTIGAVHNYCNAVLWEYYGE